MESTVDCLFDIWLRIWQTPLKTVMLMSVEIQNKGFLVKVSDPQLLKKASTQWRWLLFIHSLTHSMEQSPS